MILKDSSTISSLNYKAVLSKEDSMLNKKNDLKDSFKTNVLGKDIRNHQRRLVNHSRRFLQNRQKLVSISNINGVGIIQPNYFIYNPYRIRTFHWPLRRFFKRPRKIIRFGKEYGLEKKSLKINNSFNISSRFIPSMQGISKLKLMNRVKSLRKRKVHKIHHRYRKVKNFYVHRKIHDNSLIPTKWHHEFKENSSKISKKFIKGIVFKKAPEFLFGKQASNVTNDEIRFIDDFNKSVQNHYPKIGIIGKTFSNKKKSDKITEKSKTEPHKRFGSHYGNCNGSEIDKAVFINDNDYFDTIIDDSSRRWNKGALNLVDKQFKAWILFVELVVLISAVSSLLFFIYCNLRNRIGDIWKTTDIYKQQCREESRLPLLKDGREDKELIFKKHEDNYRIYFEHSTEELDTSEMLSSFATKMDEDVKSSTESKIDFHGKDIIGADLIRLKSTFKPNDKISQIFKHQFDLSNTKSELLENFSKSIYHYPDKLNSPNCHLLQQIDPKTDHLSKEFKLFESPQQQVNQRSIQNTNTRVEVKPEKSKELVDLGSKPESQNQKPFSGGDLIKENERDCSVKINHLMQEFETSCKSEKVKKITNAFEDNDKDIYINDIMSPETQLSIWRRTFVVQEKITDHDQSDLISLLFDDNYSKTNKKVPKRWKSSIPTWKGKSRLKLSNNLKINLK